MHTSLNPFIRKINLPYYLLTTFLQANRPTLLMQSINILKKQIGFTLQNKFLKQTILSQILQNNLPSICVSKLMNSTIPSISNTIFLFKLLLTLPALPMDKHGFESNQINNRLNKFFQIANEIQTPIICRCIPNLHLNIFTFLVY